MNQEAAQLVLSNKNYILYPRVVELYVIRNMYKCIKREDRRDETVAKNG
jgi:hypothetical protein